MPDKPIAGRDPYQSLRYPEFRNYLLASFLLTVALLVQEVIIGYELYKVTHDPLALGLTGLAEALPFIGLSLFGGHIADRVSKRKIILWSVASVFVCSVMLHLFARNAQRVSPTALVAVMYAVIAFIGVCRAFQSPASASLRAFLTPIAAYENASTWNSSSWQVGSIVGPAISGFVYALLGFSNTLLLVVILVAGSFLLYSRIEDKPVPVPNKTDNLMASLREGIAFVFRTKIIFYAISLDLFSVLFGGVVAILPIFAEDILRVGPEGLGILRSAPSVGAVLTLVIVSRISVMERAWQNLLIAVTGFGISILIFALSPWMWLSTAALFFSGAFDSVSVVIRGTLLQLLTPDEMRGRVMGVNGMFVSSSNEIGAFESGLAARLLGTIPSVVFGGAMTLMIVAWVYARSKELLKGNLRV
ncbi:MAG: MFS transporter [Bacteroidota bacterium]